MESGNKAAVEGREGNGEESEEEGFPSGRAGGPAVDVPKEDVFEAKGSGKGFRGGEAASDEWMEEEWDGKKFAKGAKEVAGMREGGGPGFRDGAKVDEGPKEKLGGADAASQGSGTGGKRGFRNNRQRIKVGGKVCGREEGAGSGPRAGDGGINESGEKPDAGRGGE